jgi:hypothetical protein
VHHGATNEPTAEHALKEGKAKARTSDQRHSHSAPLRVSSRSTDLNVDARLLLHLHATALASDGLHLQSWKLSLGARRQTYEQLHGVPAVSSNRATSITSAEESPSGPGLNDRRPRSRRSSPPHPHTPMHAGHTPKDRSDDRSGSANSARGEISNEDIPSRLLVLQMPAEGVHSRPQTRMHLVQLHALGCPRALTDHDRDSKLPARVRGKNSNSVTRNFSSTLCFKEACYGRVVLHRWKIQLLYSS